MDVEFPFNIPIPIQLPEEDFEIISLVHHTHRNVWSITTTTKKFTYLSYLDAK